MLKGVICHVIDPPQKPILVSLLLPVSATYPQTYWQLRDLIVLQATSMPRLCCTALHLCDAVQPPAAQARRLYVNQHTLQSHVGNRHCIIHRHGTSKLWRTYSSFVVRDVHVCIPMCGHTGCEDSRSDRIHSATSIAFHYTRKFHRILRICFFF